MNAKQSPSSTARITPRSPPAARRDYSRWSVEELRALAVQLQIRDGASKTRPELMELFGVAPVERLS